MRICRTGSAHTRSLRFGASGLANDILMQFAKTVDGNYQSGDYLPLP